MRCVERDSQHDLGMKPPTFGDDGDGGVAGTLWVASEVVVGAAGGIGAAVAVSVWRICERYTGNHGGLCGPTQRNDIV
jgi:hypothetical protein